MPHEDDGLTIARERIAEEARTRTGFLDLGRLGLDELPAELLALTHLRRLNLGDGYVDDEGEWVRAISEIAPNRLDSQLHRLAVLPCLGALSVTGAQLTTLAGVTQLRTLQSLDCSETQVTDLSPLSELSALQSLDCSETWVTDLSPLSELSALQSLDCSETQVTDLSPVSGLSALQSLNCSETQVTDLSPLSRLSALPSLHCSATQVTDLSPLSRLSALQSLNCSETQVTDLSPLSGLSALQSLNCSQCTLSTIPGDLWHKPSLRYLCLFETQMPEIRTEVLSQNNYMSCLESLRAHLSDLRAGAAAVPDVKLMVLGNGRVGKTQICRRLRGESYDPRVPS